VSETDQALLSATASGDGDAFAAFFRRHEAAVTRFAIRRCANADEVADAVAETFLVALRRASAFDARHGDARPWLFGIAQRVVRGQRRSFARRARLTRRASSLPAYEPDEAARVDAAIDAERRVDDLRPRLDELARRDRAVLELVAYADLSPSEAAAALGISANAARLRLARARRRLGETVTEVSYAG
jgi:RNA polymerase sigma-70 factor (ECF subfamily)